MSGEAVATVREAAALSGQDMTSFVMSAALERARAILAEDRLLRLSPAAVLQLETALDREAEAVTQLAALFRRYGATDNEADLRVDERNTLSP